MASGVYVLDDCMTEGLNERMYAWHVDRQCPSGGVMMPSAERRGLGTGFWDSTQHPLPTAVGSSRALLCSGWMHYGTTWL